ncbi:uncharacterized protein LOC144448392 [Glandiceps talaboti]
MSPKLRITLVCLLVVTQLTLAVSANMCADEDWYFDVNTLRCKLCTVCLEELGQMESSPCNEFSDAVCIQPSQIVLPSFQPEVTTDSSGDPEDGTLPPFDPEYGVEILPGDPEERVGDEPTVKVEPINEEQQQIKKLDKEVKHWKYTSYALSVTVIVLSAIILAMTVYICRSLRHVKQIIIHHADSDGKMVKHDLEAGVFTNLQAEKRNHRLFSRDRLSTADFLQSLSIQDKKHGSQEGLFDQVIHPPPNMYRVDSNEDVFYESNTTKQTSDSDTVATSVPCNDATTAKGNIVTNEDNYTRNDARLQDPTVCTKATVPDFIPSVSQGHSVQQSDHKHTVVNFVESRGISVSTMKSFDI